MAVLVNEESYSAAEFFAAALQEYDAAAVVGAKTYGKGNFQNTFRLSDGSAIAISVGKYFTPGATSNGVEYHLDAIASCVIGGVSMKGGVGSVFGVVIGVLIMGALQNGLNIMGVSPYWQQICKGLIIIVAVVADTLKKGSDR